MAISSPVSGCHLADLMKIHENLMKFFSIVGCW